MITHDNLAHNESLIIRELKADQNTICVSWLPQYHDMGLIGSYLGTLYCGGSGYYLSPISFLKDPMVDTYLLILRAIYYFEISAFLFLFRSG
jgi:acyl-CoA synthetase (AMP-forming)/AMP-acid ligase II